MVTILVLEDHQVTLDGLIQGLACESDFQIVGSAGDSDTGLALAQELSPDIVLLDLHMPGSLGPRSMVEAFCSLPRSKVVVFSSETRVAFIEIVLQLGAAGYLLKSESASSVANFVREVMAGNQPIMSCEISSRRHRLTSAEQQLLEMFARGMKYQDIANRRMTTVSTVRKQSDLLLLKLGLENREELIAWAAKNGYGNFEVES